MNEEQLIEFINWLPTAVPEFQNAQPEQIVQALNQMYESEEGQQMLSQLFTAFQESKADAQSQMFKKGGKLGRLVEKAKKGKKMCCKKKAILQGGMVNKVTEKMQEGGEAPSLTRREAREQATANRGFSRGQFQMAMANAKNALRGAGLRGRDLRQQARQMVAGQHAQPVQPVETEFVPQVRKENPIIAAPLESSARLESLLPGRATTSQVYGIIEREAPSFNDVFAKSRAAGLKEFTYNGKRYNTLYEEEMPMPGVDPKYNFRTPWSAGYTDLDLARQGTGYYVTAPEYQKRGGELAANTSANTLSNFGLLPKAQSGENNTNDWFQSTILEEIPNMNFIQRRQLGPNSYVHELSATREGLASPTLGRMIETNPATGQSDTTYVRFFMDQFTEPIFTNMTGSAKKQADSKIEGLRDKANSKGAKIRK